MQPLPVSTPAAQGVDAAAVRLLVEAWEQAGVRPFALVLARHGAVVASATWAPYRPDDRQLKYSLSKTFTASAVGLAVADGLLTVDRTVASFFPEVTGVGPRAATITVAHLLSMATGHTVDTYEQLDGDDVPGSFLRIEPDAEPGTLFCYHNSATLMLSVIVQQVTGEPLHTYLRPRLLDPLGIGDIDWLTVGPYDQGFSGLHTTCDAVARLGLTLLDHGRFAGRQVLPEQWVDEAMTVHVANGSDPASDWEQGYGYQMWRGRHGWRGDGAFGQLCLVLPEQDAVLAVLAQAEDMQVEMDAVWDHLLPGLHDEPLDDDGADRALTEFLDARTLATVASTAAPRAGLVDLAAIGPAAATIAPHGRLQLDDGVLVVDEGDGPLRVPLGDGHWTRAALALPSGRTVTVAGTGGWTAPGVLEARVVPLHSPHVLQVRVDVDAGTADLRWQAQPLGTLTLTGSSWRPGPS